MKKIKFSHMYEKLKNINVSEPVHLVETMFVELNQLTDEFLEYDTAFYDGTEKNNYPLKDGEYIILFFVDSNFNLFTTIRRQTPNKNEYYSTSIGCEFEVVINSSNRSKDIKLQDAQKI